MSKKDDQKRKGHITRVAHGTSCIYDSEFDNERQLANRETVVTASFENYAYTNYGNTSDSLYLDNITLTNKPEELFELFSIDYPKKALDWIKGYLGNLTDIIEATNSGPQWTNYADPLAKTIYKNNGLEPTKRFWNGLLEYFNGDLLKKANENREESGRVDHLHRGHILFNLGTLSFNEAFIQADFDKEYMKKHLRIAKKIFLNAMKDNETLEKNYEHAPKAENTSSYTQLGIIEILLQVIKTYGKSEKGTNIKLNQKEEYNDVIKLLIEMFNYEIQLTPEEEVKDEKKAEESIKKILTQESIKQMKLMQYKAELDSITKQNDSFPIATIVLSYSILEALVQNAEYTDISFKNFNLVKYIIECFRNRIHPQRESSLKLP